MSADEYCVFTLVVQLADYHTGVWYGSGVAVSDYLKWCPRKCQLTLKSLESKHYIKLRPTRGKKGNYPVIIHNYHGSVEKVANRDASLLKTGEPGCVTTTKVANGDATLKEVIQEVHLKKNAAQPRRATSPLRSEEEQRRIVNARDRRLEKEEEARKEVAIGVGPYTEVFLKMAAGKKL